MGTRGPIKGKGGRPPGGNAPKRKRASKKTVKSNGSFVAELATLKLKDLERLAGQFRELTPADGIALALFWDALERYNKLNSALDGEKLTFETEKGYVGALPEVSMLNKTIDQIITLAGKFGMSPADRSRLGESPPEPETPADPFAAHLANNESIARNATKKQPRRRR